MSIFNDVSRKKKSIDLFSGRQRFIAKCLSRKLHEGIRTRQGRHCVQRAKKEATKRVFSRFHARLNLCSTVPTFGEFLSSTVCFCFLLSSKLPAIVPLNSINRSVFIMEEIRQVGT